MRYQELENLYHVTFTKNIKNILEKGLEQLHPSNWVRVGDFHAGKKTRYNEEAGIFAFGHPIDAINWATKMIYEFKQKVSIVKIKMDPVWRQDPSQDPNLLFGKGRSMRSLSNIKSSDIIKIYNMENFGTPLSTDMGRDDWLEGVSKIISK